jgi:hypothetical protein
LYQKDGTSEYALIRRIASGIETTRYQCFILDYSQEDKIQYLLTLLEKNPNVYPSSHNVHQSSAVSMLLWVFGWVYIFAGVMIFMLSYESLGTIDLGILMLAFLAGVLLMAMAKITTNTDHIRDMLKR